MIKRPNCTNSQVFTMISSQFPTELIKMLHSKVGFSFRHTACCSDSFSSRCRTDGSDISLKSRLVVSSGLAINFAEEVDLTFLFYKGNSVVSRFPVRLEFFVMSSLLASQGTLNGLTKKFDGRTPGTEIYC